MPAQVEAKLQFPMRRYIIASILAMNTPAPLELKLDQEVQPHQKLEIEELTIIFSQNAIEATYPWGGQFNECAR